MKVTRLGPPSPILSTGFGNSYSILPAGGTAGQALTANGSNGSYWFENVARITSNGSNALLGPFVNFASGSNTIFSVTSNTLNIGTTGGGGASTLITSNGSNSLSGTINLQAGVGIALGVSGQTITITNTGVPGAAGGGGSSTIQYGTLKPTSPLDDFAAASLDGAWSAHSVAGTFVTGNCFTRARDGSHLSIGLNSQNGVLYRTATNVDQEWIVGGLEDNGSVAAMIGIAILDSAGTGVGIVSYTDGNCYLSNITTWTYTSLISTFTGYGRNLAYDRVYAMRLTRVTNTWDGYISMDGNNWVHSASTGSVTITAAYKAIGVFYDGSTGYKGRILADWVNTV